ncbi:hypothetical protein CRUP_013683 [Coryphaenoides rupestris]|nr:hypothetical protein CRUP_013683 [Coryphaenoides rupestris]
MESEGGSSETRLLLTESQVLDFPGDPYSVSVLKVGYCVPQPDGSSRADGTVTLVSGTGTGTTTTTRRRTILVDTGGPWDRDFLLSALGERGLDPGHVDWVVGTHGHSDHIGNLGLFQKAVVVVGCDMSEGDRYIPNHLAEGTPYHIDQHALSENAALQRVNRARALSTADVIIPGHGRPFMTHRNPQDR